MGDAVRAPGAGPQHREERGPAGESPSPGTAGSAVASARTGRRKTRCPPSSQTRFRGGLCPASAPGAPEGRPAPAAPTCPLCSLTLGRFVVCHVDQVAPEVPAGWGEGQRALAGMSPAHHGPDCE